MNEKEKREIYSKMDAFGSDKDFEIEILKPMGFESEKDLLENTDQMSEEQLKEVIEFSLEHFDYDTEERARIVHFLLRGVFNTI